MATAEGTNGQLTEGTVSPQSGNTLPQTNVSTYPSQLFWLAVTFGLLYLILSRITLPRLTNALESRRNKIAGDLDEAEKFRNEAQEALTAYEAALAEARARALTIVEENRKQVTAEAERQRAEAEAVSAKATAEGESRIEAMWSAAMAHVQNVAAETATAIVAKLIGETVPADEALEALNGGRR